MSRRSEKKRHHKQNCDFVPFNLPCNRSEDEYGFLYTRGMALPLPPIPDTGLVVPGTTATIPGIAPAPAGAPIIMGAVIPWNSTGPLLNVQRQTNAARISIGGDINMEYTFTPTLTLTVPVGFTFESFPPGAQNVAFVIRAALYAINSSNEVALIPGTEQVADFGFVGTIALILSLIGSSLPATIPLQTPIELVGQAIATLPAGTRIVLVVTTTVVGADGILTLVPPSALPFLSIVAPMVPPGAGGGTGTLASLDIVREGVATGKNIF